MELTIRQLAEESRLAGRHLARLHTREKNHALLAMAEQLTAQETDILAANSIDLQAAQERGMSTAMQDRLMLTSERLSQMAKALLEVAQLPDPVGEISDIRVRPNGMQVGMMRIPLGVIAIIYEARPNVTSDAAGLCLKSGNAVILRGGSESFHSNQAIVHALQRALKQCRVDPAAITLFPTVDRHAMVELLKLDQQIDLVIPRGGEGLIRFVAENSRIPVIKHYKGVCHLYVDEDADLDMAVRLLIDGKTSRPGVCNALETLLVHKQVAKKFLPLANAALDKKGVELRGCPLTCSILPKAVAATEADYDTEYLALILSVRVVENYEQALAHLERHSSNHTDVIVTNNLRTSQRFLRDVQSSSVMVNASSRFADGGELGLGAEIGISTTKLHAYGPMGLEALTTKKFIVIGDGQTRHKVDPEG